MPKVDFVLDERALTVLKPYFHVQGGSVAIVCGVFTGEFVVKRDFRSYGGEVIEGNGFGSGGGLREAFVLQSVTEVHECS